jgi:hypothetical protein
MLNSIIDQFHLVSIWGSLLLKCCLRVWEGVDAFAASQDLLALVAFQLQLEVWKASTQGTLNLEQVFETSEWHWMTPKKFLVLDYLFSSCPYFAPSVLPSSIRFSSSF